MRSMSFYLTTRQIRDRTKTVTRRRGWRDLRPGERLWAVEKVQGLRRGERHNRLAVIRIVSVRREPLSAIDQADVDREGFPGRTPAEFVAMFCANIGGEAGQHVTRIEFDYEDASPPRTLFPVSGDDAPHDPSSTRSTREKAA